MSEAEARLQALWAADEPPVRDRAFEAAVMAEVARRRFRRDLALLGIVTVAGTAALAAFAPDLSGLASVDPLVWGPALSAASLGWLIGWGPLRPSL